LKKILFPLFLMTFFSGLFAWQGWRVWENTLGHETLPLKIGAVFVPAGIAGLIYLLAGLWLEIPAAKELLEFAAARFKRAK
jgi:TRAP-type C4-dicarboxylate transport system permease small subunit